MHQEPQPEHASPVAHGVTGIAAPNGHVPAEDVAVETLLGRSVIDVSGNFGEYLADASVLVTGAGGSVGVELCARLARLGVRELVLLDHAEASLVALARALRQEVGFANALPVLADIKSRTRIFDVFDRHRPDVAFHAAAYKHVPLLEASPVEGVATNVLGTKSIVDAARRAGVGRFVLFSTDKAVQPTSVLGQTKSIAEWIVATNGSEPGQGRYASVRLGNVVDSAGSILPLFRDQVARGGPVTVTDPNATRYLLTAGEAAELAIVAGCLADSESVFWLDSGPPVPILELARRIASAASYEVDVDFVGLRAGERLHEQLFSSSDEVETTPCDRVWRTAMRKVDPAWLDRWLAVLERHVQGASVVGVRAALAAMHSAPGRQTIVTTVAAG